MSFLVGVRVCAVSFLRVCGLKTTVSMPKRAKKNEEAVDGETGNGAGTVLIMHIRNKVCIFRVHQITLSVFSQNLQRKRKKGKSQRPRFCMKILQIR